MKRIFYIIVFLFVMSLMAESQVLLNNDKSKGKIENQGTIRVRTSGSIIGMPDTIGGRVEFVADRPEWRQIIPNVVYRQLFISGATPKIADSLWNAPGTKPLATLDSLIVTGTIFIVDSVEVNAKSTVKNANAQVVGKRDVRLNGDQNSQNIFGDGKFNQLNIDNDQGVDVVEGGGFSVRKKLELTRGELRNDTNNNFIVEDSATIIRHVGSSLAYEPSLGKDLTLRYVGDGSLITSGETPTDSTKLSVLSNETTQGVTISRNVTVNDSLYLKSPIKTETATDTSILTLTSYKNPVFDGFDAEIDGSFRRTKLLLDGSRNLFNNPYTWISFIDPASAANINEMTFRIKPKTFPPFDKGDLKVERFLSITARDQNYDYIKTGMLAELGYGWRVSQNQAKDESRDLTIDDLILQRWDTKEWMDIETSKKPQVLTFEEWAFSSATEISVLGDFAIGMPGGMMLTLQSRVLLEGPYRFGSMADDLRVKGLIPLTPPDMYPYNLDPNRQFTSVRDIPDSVVDWVVLEFRPSFNSVEKYYRTVFVKIDGKIVDLDGISPVLLSKGGIDSGEYYIALRHRNHLAVITENKVNIFPETIQQVLDFSDPSILMGRNNAVRPIGYDNLGNVLWGLYSGDINGDGVINQADLVGAWDARDLEGYYSTDNNMSGIVNTRDFNFSWNNRGKSTFVP